MVQTYFTIVHWTNNGKIVPFLSSQNPLLLATSYSFLQFSHYEIVAVCSQVSTYHFDIFTNKRTPIFCASNTCYLHMSEFMTCLGYKVNMQINLLLFTYLPKWEFPDMLVSQNILP